MLLLSPRLRFGYGCIMGIPLPQYASRNSLKSCVGVYGRELCKVLEYIKTQKPRVFILENVSGLCHICIPLGTCAGTCTCLLQQVSRILVAGCMYALGPSLLWLH
jgi:hypothetical protein